MGGIERGCRPAGFGNRGCGGRRGCFFWALIDQLQLKMNSLGKMAFRHLFDAGKKIVPDPLEHEAIGRHQGEGKRGQVLQGLQVKRPDPGIVLLSAEFLLEMFETGKPEGIH